ncbi:deleted in malignant brain tumors 1 protein-like [Tympanuchus pallidicinctus]|uniref:deleted in malignant brain tumors 1 protein-like n=1 Tax=Tympanuchus pallidicinctus TaxID=109042 RepID=UPI002287408E|nr:deleted in malignant brain tumors 1 protein-like [Tympanuchus pallidicinctus]
MMPARVLGLLLSLQLCMGSEELRLVDGGGRCAGRVEVKHEGEWGSVCSYNIQWSMQAATVVCRQLGCGTVAHRSPYAPFGQGKGRIWLHPYFCDGTETKLQNCLHFGFGNHFCGHDRDVGVICTEALELRLVDGGGPCEGRVEMKLRGRWGTVSDFGWNMNHAEVVCQQLGCGSASHTTFTWGISQVHTPLMLAIENCNGNEKTIWDCNIFGWGPYNTPRFYNASVVCQGFSRLAGGDSECSGRLEVRQGQAWVSVCHGHVDLMAAHVVCRELGCGTALALYGTEQFGAAEGPFWHGAFECNGTEPLLSACTQRPPHIQTCTQNTAIICSYYTGFRLVDGGSACTGRVEVEAQGVWGPLCATAWDLPDAHVLCHHLGCGSAISLLPPGHFGKGIGTLRRDAFSCSGNEWHLGKCPVDVLGQPACPPGHTAAVNCSGVTEPLRLHGGESRCDGQLEVAVRPGAWARVSVGLWDNGTATVACRQLGCGVPEKIYAAPANGSGPMELQELRCVGTEGLVAQCNISGMATELSRSPEDLAIACSGSKQLRLVGGPGRCAGRVEVYSEGRWGTVCQDTWTLQDATVVCRQLGCGWALEAPGSERFGPGTGTLWPGAGGCSGTEDALWHCAAPVQRGCQIGGGAGAVCSGLLDLRLTGKSSRCSGYLEVLHEGTWGPVCANGTSPATATAVCRQLGCGSKGELGEPVSAEGLEPAWLSWVSCEEGARSLWRCPSAPWQLQECDTTGITYISCDEDARDSSEATSPAPALTHSAVPLTAAPSRVSALTVLCVVLGTLLCLALAALAVLAHRTRAQSQGPSKDAASEVVYEELDYSLMPDYQEVPSHTGSLSQGSGKKVSEPSGDGAEESNLQVSPDPLAEPHHSPSHGYDDAMAVLEVSVSPHLGDAPAQPPEDTGYDDVGVSTLGTSLAAAPTQGHAQHPGRLAPLGDTQAVSPVVGLRDARSGDKSHIWARSRLLEAGTQQAADNPADNGSHRTSPSPLAPASRGCLYLPLPILGCRLCMWGTMMPARVLGLLLSLQLCMGSEELRLVDGGGRCAGRVEVKHEGEWGSVCSYDFDWDIRGASVVCRQLGCGTVAHASPYAPFGQGKGRIWLHPFFCRGTETKLENCPHFGWGNHFCGHEWDVGVICTEALELRLADGGGPCEGRVEMKLRGRWGTVTDDAWDMDDAEVVCQQLGCGSAAGAFFASQFRSVDGPIMLAFIDCRGDEAALWNCNIRGWGPYNGPHDYDIAVVCQGFSRLAGGDSECSGRLEVRQGQAWVSVCHGHVDLMAAHVVCRELGCGTALALYGTEQFGAAEGPFWHGAFECNGTEPLLSACTQRPPHIQTCTQNTAIICSYYTGFRLVDGGSACTGRVEVEAQGVWGPLCATAWDLPDAHILCHHLGCGSAISLLPPGHFGKGIGTLRRDAFSCSGNEWHLGKCPVDVLGQPACPPGHTAAVNCSGVTEPLRLHGGESRCDGQLEVAVRPGAWARVSVGLWDNGTATVACRQLGCGVPEKIYAAPANGSGPMELQELRCVGTEGLVAQCNISGMATELSRSPEDLAIACSGSKQLRLVGGPGRCAGRVEVYSEGRWGTVCQDTWTLQDATVVCRQLGCGWALEAPGSERFGPGTGTLWPGAGGCSGTEDALWHCAAPVQRGCQIGGGAGAVCSGLLDLRLTGKSSRCSGYLEVLHEGTWGPVCANGTSPATATAVCRQLGCGSKGELEEPVSAEGLEPAWLSWVSCEEGARSLWRCPSAPWQLQECDTTGITYISCDEDARDSSEATSPAPALTHSAVPLTAAPSRVSALTVLCVVLGTLLCLALAALAVLAHRTRAQSQGPSKDAASEVVYEELDYSLMPDYQEVPSHTGSLSQGSGKKVSEPSGDGAEESNLQVSPGRDTGTEVHCEDRRAQDTLQRGQKKTALMGR